MSVKIFVCGDIIIQRPKKCLIADNLKEIIKSADVAVCNLEGPVKSSADKISKVGPYLEQSEEVISILREAGFNLFSLANNHILDFKEPGLTKTLREINKTGAQCIGAGMDFNSAYGLNVSEINSLKIGFLAFAESGFGVLSDGASQGGYAWINHPLVNGIVKESKTKVDFLIIMAHAGVEDTLLPLPEWRARYKELCDCGADIIIGHHPHWPQGFERHGRSLIFYSLGNFCFDHLDIKSKGSVSYSVLLGISKSGFDFRVIWHKKTNAGVMLLEDKKLDNFLAKISSLLSKPYASFMNQQIAYLYASRYKKYLGIGLENKTIDFVKRFIMFRRFKQYKTMMRLHNSIIESHRYTISRAEELIRKKEMASKYPDITAIAKEYSDLNLL